jgi:hypothetical protein
MAGEGNLDYALARVHARHGQRLDETDWRRLEASRELGQYLDSVRASALTTWVTSLDPTRDAHAIERTLRLEWRQYVEGVAIWHPREYQPWLAWCAWLPVLSLLARLSRPEPAPTWLLADPLCGPVAPGSPAERAAALQKTELAPLAPAVLGRIPMGSAWLAHWQTLTPRSDAQTRQLVGRILRAIDTHLDRLLNNAADTLALRKGLADQLMTLFRAGGSTTAATVCHLALLALDLERLRGGLVSRSVVAVRAAEAA